MAWLKHLAGKVLEGAGLALEIAVGVGLVSGTTVALVMGQFVLAAVLAAALLGILLRFKRGRLARRAPRRSTS
jgi:hypothetical protein